MKSDEIINNTDQFRYHSVDVETKNGVVVSIQHPTYIFFENESIYVYVVITHSSKVKDHIVLKLNKNPNPRDKRDSFWVAEIKEDIKQNFGRKHNNWTIDILDKNEILSFFENYLNKKG